MSRLRQKQKTAEERYVRAQPEDAKANEIPGEKDVPSALGKNFFAGLGGALKNAVRAMAEYDDHGGIRSNTVPLEFEDGESGTNSWPVPAWWTRVPNWVDRAPDWWEKFTRHLASEHRIAGQMDPSMFNVVN